MNFIKRIFLFERQLIFNGLIFFSCFLMAKIIFPYFSWKWNVDFLMTKQLIVHLDHYRIAFYSHIFSSLIVLFSGVLLFSPIVLKHYPRLHKISGKLHVGLILFISGPSGLIMAYYANGGLWVKVSFLILTPLWWFFTFRGYTSIRNGNVKKHKSWMIRSFALTLSAISLRLYQLILGQYAIIDPEVQYLLVSWVSWVGNLVIAEIYIRYLAINNFDKRREIY